MAIKPLNSIGGFSVGQTPINIIDANGNVTTSNLTTTGAVALGNISNISILGGTEGQLLSTDGQGNLTFTTIDTSGLSNGTSSVDVLDSGNINFVANGNTSFVVTQSGANVVGTFDVTGNLTGNAANFSGNVKVGGLITDNLYHANGAVWDLELPAGSNNQIQYNSNGSFGASSAFTFDPTTNVFAVSGTANVTDLNVSNNFTAASGNVTGDLTVQNLITGGGTGGGAITGANSITSNYFVGNGSLLTDITGENVSGEVANANYAAFAGQVVDATQSNITSLGTLTGLTVDGSNITLANGAYVGNGAGLTNINGGNVSEVANAAYATNAGVAGSVSGNAQANITSVGTLTSLDISGALGGNTANFAGNLAAANISTTGAVAAGSLAVTGVANLGDVSNVEIAGGSSGQFLQTDGAGNLTWATVDSSTLSNGTSNVDIATLDGPITMGVGGNANVMVVTASGMDVTGYANVSGTATVGNLSTAGTVTANGNISGANVSANGAISATGDISGANLSATGAVSGNTGSFSGNVVVNNISANGSVEASSVDATGNIVALGDMEAANFVTGGTVTANGNISGDHLVANTGVVTDSITNKSGNLVVTSNANVVFSTTGVISAGGSIIANVGTPVSDADAATKLYVDNLVSSGIHYHAPVRVESPTALNATYNNGTAGVGATLTNAGANAALVIDGVTVNVADRVLVYQQADATQNGVYVVTVAGDGSTAWVLTRAADADTWEPQSDTGLDEGSYFFVQEGVTGAGESYVCSTVGEITFGTTAINFAQFSKAPIYTAGTGLGLYGNNEFYLANTNVTAGEYGNGDSVATFTVNSQGQLTAASNVAITANAANLSGTSLNSNIVSSNLTSVGTLANLTVTGNIAAGNVTATDISGTTLGGTLTTAAQPNVTSVGTLTSLDVTGTATVGNLSTAGTVTATGNISGGNLSTAGTVTATGDISGANLSATGTVTATGNVSGGNITTVGVVSATGNVSGGNITTAGVVAATGNVSGGNITTVGVVSATGNVSGGNLVTSGEASVGTKVALGTTTIAHATVTTTSTTSTAIATIPVSGVTGVEFLVKGIDSAGAKYSVATVQAVTDSANVDFSIYGTVNIGTYTGTLDVAIDGSNLVLSVEAATSNSTVWTTQYRLI